MNNYKIIGNYWIFEYYRNPKNRQEWIKNSMFDMSLSELRIAWPIT